MEPSHPLFGIMISLLRLPGVYRRPEAELRAVLSAEPTFEALGKDRDLVFYEIADRLKWNSGPLSPRAEWTDQYSGRGQTTGGGRRVRRKHEPES